MHQHEEYYKKRDQAALEKEEKARKRKESAEQKKLHKMEEKKRRLEARQLKKAAKEAEDRARARRKLEETCSFCAASWKGGQKWLWCDHCDLICICPSCNKNPNIHAEFEKHEGTHLIH